MRALRFFVSLPPSAPAHARDQPKRLDLFLIGEEGERAKRMPIDQWASLHKMYLQSPKKRSTAA
ncbi:hypothetical protein GCM10007362_42240 [Saccharibacillus endophyticus]|uniref:Uncharacterized protein n=1 Tax=Saccharibacillus endophyticus TaxID=2060666 RepID=A0ABQ2A346_9BACL|nr:hypothetical protein GCM10007362_42240 [Saccharibacillus endophyticus]